MDKLDLVGLTNALTDIVVNVSDEELKSIWLQKGVYGGLSKTNNQKLFELLNEKEKKFFQAGSPANVIFNSARLGLNTALLGTVGDDDIGEKYRQKLKDSGIDSHLGISRGNSGVCYVLITPDGERTCIANMGIAGAFNFSIKKIKEAGIFHTSGYELISNPAVVLESVDYAKKIGAKISFDLADPAMIRKQRSNIMEIIKKTDILFMTEEESRELTGEDEKNSLKIAGELCDIAILKKSSKGSIVRHNRQEYKIPIYATKVVNTCGAGDAYACGFLFAHIKKFPIFECGNMASYLASRVCSIADSHL